MFSDTKNHVNATIRMCWVLTPHNHKMCIAAMARMSLSVSTWRLRLCLSAHIAHICFSFFLFSFFISSANSQLCLCAASAYVASSFLFFSSFVCRICKIQSMAAAAKHIYYAKLIVVLFRTRMERMDEPNILASIINTWPECGKSFRCTHKTHTLDSLQRMASTEFVCEFAAILPQHSNFCPKQIK